MTRRTFLGLMASTVLPGSALALGDQDREPEYLRPWLMPGTCRRSTSALPLRPRIVNVKEMGRQPGTYGGSLRTIIGSDKDIRFMTIYGYARLVGYDQKLQLQPDILEAFETTDARVFTFQIRPGTSGRTVSR